MQILCPTCGNSKHQLLQNREKSLKSIIEVIKDLYCIIIFFFLFANVIKPHEHYANSDDELEVFSHGS